MWNRCLYSCDQLDPDVLPAPTASDIQYHINFTSPHGDVYAVIDNSQVTAVDYRAHFSLSLTLPVRGSDISKFSAIVKTIWNTRRGKRY